MTQMDLPTNVEVCSRREMYCKEYTVEWYNPKEWGREWTVVWIDPEDKASVEAHGVKVHFDKSDEIMAADENAGLDIRRVARIGLAFARALHAAMTELGGEAW